MSIAIPNSVQAHLAVGRGWLWLGVAIALGAMALQMLQLFAVKWLFTPWYLPVLGTIAVGCIAISFMQRRTIGRLIVLVFFGLLAAFEWWVLLGLSPVPAYAGPKKGEPFPPFEAVRANGTTFTHHDFMGTEETVLVVFRGRW